MGKKGKKSKRQKGSKVGANRVVLRNIESKIEKMATIVHDNIPKNQYTEAASRQRDIITYLASQEKAIMKASAAITGDTQGGNLFGRILKEQYSTLVFFEYYFRKNYDKVIQIYNELASKYAHVVILGAQNLEENRTSSSDSFDMKILQLYYELALIRTGKSLCNIPILKSFIVRLIKDEPTKKAMLLRIEIIQTLRIVKEYDHAIDIDSKLSCISNLIERDALDVKASLFITYLERYRVEKHQSLQSAKAKNFSVIIEPFTTIPKSYQSTRSGIDESFKQDYELAMAQMCYLCHKMNNEQWEQECIDKAIGWVESIARFKWIIRSICSTCRESNTRTELQLVCSECQVSCYCGIDHQRISWMKNEVKGTRLGHKVLCPVLKAYRIWMDAKENGNEERKAKMERRFKKECISFLAFGLGLKDKCFEAKDFPR